VCEVGKAYFSQSLSTTFGDPRLTLMYDDAARYLRNEGASQVPTPPTLLAHGDGPH